MTDDLWQPIETAPKDMRNILLFVPGSRIGSFQEEADEIYIGFRKGDGWLQWPDNYCYVPKPSHWMPLPANPAKYRPEPSSINHVR